MARMTRAARGVVRLLSAQLVASLAFLMICCGPSVRETYVVPEGYEGPIIVLFGIHGGEDYADEDGARTYVLGMKGVLKLRSEKPPHGWYLRRFYFASADGSRIEIPSEKTATMHQAFSVIDGSVGMQDGRITNVSYTACVVGVPASRDDWAIARNEAVEEAVRHLRDAELPKDVKVR